MKYKLIWILLISWVLFLSVVVVFGREGNTETIYDKRNITGCVHGDSMDKDVCDKFDLPETPEVERPTVVIPPQPLMTEGK